MAQPISVTARRLTPLVADAGAEPALPVSEWRCQPTVKIQVPHRIRSDSSSDRRTIPGCCLPDGLSLCRADRSPPNHQTALASSTPAHPGQEHTTNGMIGVDTHKVNPCGCGPRYPQRRARRMPDQRTRCNFDQLMAWMEPFGRRLGDGGAQIRRRKGGDDPHAQVHQRFGHREPHASVQPDQGDPADRSGRRARATGTSAPHCPDPGLRDPVARPSGCTSGGGPTSTPDPGASRSTLGAGIAALRNNLEPLTQAGCPVPSQTFAWKLTMRPRC